MAEREIQNEIRLAISREGLGTTFRNNSGQAWVGQLVSRNGRDIILRDARALHAGLCSGSSDLIGWTPVIYYPGKPVALFTAIEVKSPRGRLTAEQRNFLDQVHAAGGIGIEARSADEAVGAIKEWIQGRS